MDYYVYDHPSLHPEFFQEEAYSGLKDGPLAEWVPVRRRAKFVDTSPTVAEIRAKYAEINLMRYISQTTKKNPSVFFGSIKQF
jgi:hypothetical protein